MRLLWNIGKGVLICLKEVEIRWNLWGWSNNGCARFMFRPIWGDKMKWEEWEVKEGFCGKRTSIKTWAKRIHG